ncbi:hypothetical protein NPX13_g6536 [Xylaria arbuscula]|uniref:Uncharacterized protein n=1 Tax=Xylaria arbuscula TaxID=114810 RepID=A0A9W8NCP5_9PEZI|nr:hypothetical protein NPX13_g6536 [Xylaria arbuscula]
MSSTTEKAAAWAEASWAAFPGAVQLPNIEHPTLDDWISAEPAVVSAIERHYFERITLTLWRTPEFEAMTRRNRAFIKCIRLNLEQERDVFGGVLGNRRTNITDSCTIMKSLYDLFCILSTFPPEHQLRLEINICPTKGLQQNDWSVDTLIPALDNQNLEDIPREILGEESLVFYNDECENAWWQSLPAAPAVRSLHLPAKDDLRWRQITLEYMVSRLLNFEEFLFEPNEQVISSQQIPAESAEQHNTLTERLGLVDSRASAIHYNPSFSGKTWAQALAYYRRVTHSYWDEPELMVLLRCFPMYP